MNNGSIIFDFVHRPEATQKERGALVNGEVTCVFSRFERGIERGVYSEASETIARASFWTGYVPTSVMVLRLPRAKLDLACFDDRFAENECFVDIVFSRGGGGVLGTTEEEEAAAQGATAEEATAVGAASVDEGKALRAVWSQFRALRAFGTSARPSTSATPSFAPCSAPARAASDANALGPTDLDVFSASELETLLGMSLDDDASAINSLLNAAGHLTPRESGSDAESDPDPSPWAGEAAPSKAAAGEAAAGEAAAGEAAPTAAAPGARSLVGSMLRGDDSFDIGEFSFIYRYNLRESCLQFDSLPLTSLPPRTTHST